MAIKPIKPDVPGATGLPSPFSSEALASIVSRTLASVPSDKNVAFVTVANQDGVKAIVAVKVHDDWTIGSYVEVDKHAIGRKITYGVEVHGFL